MNRSNKSSIYFALIKYDATISLSFVAMSCHSFILLKSSISANVVKAFQINETTWHFFCSWFWVRRWALESISIAFYVSSFLCVCVCMYVWLTENVFSKQITKVRRTHNQRSLSHVAVPPLNSSHALIYSSPSSTFLSPSLCSFASICRSKRHFHRVRRISRAVSDYFGLYPGDICSSSWNRTS